MELKKFVALSEKLHQKDKEIFNDNKNKAAHARKTVISEKFKSNEISKILINELISLFTLLCHEIKSDDNGSALIMKTARSSIS